MKYYASDVSEAQDWRYRPYLGVDRFKWPSTWWLLFTFAHGSYWKETKFTHDYVNSR